MKDKKESAIVAILRGFQAKDQEDRLGGVLRRWIEDPVKPKTNQGNLRLNPILVLLTAMAVLAGGTFLFFSMVQR